MKTIPLTIITYSHRSHPDLPLIPIGVLAFGGSDTEVFWAHVNKAQAGTRYGTEELEIAVMNDMPGWFKLVNEGVDDLVEQFKEAGIELDADKIIKEICEWSRSKTLTVADVRDVEVAAEGDIGAAVIARLYQYFEDLCLAVGSDDTCDEEEYECGFNSQLTIPREKFLN